MTLLCGSSPGLALGLLDGLAHLFLPGGLVDADGHIVKRSVFAFYERCSSSVLIVYAVIVTLLETSSISS